MRILAGVLAALTVCTLISCSSGGAPGTGQTGRTTATLPSLDPVPIAENPPAQLPVTVKGFDGRETTVTDTSRIVAIDRYGTLAQTVYALGLGSKLVGRNTAAAFPAVQHVTNVTPGGGALNVEAVAALRPTLVLADETAGTDVVREQLRAVAPVVFFDPKRTLESVVPQIDAVAAALGVPGPGQALGERTQREIAAATQSRPAGTKPRIAFLYLRSAAITMLAGPGSGADAMITAIGAEDAGTASGLTQQFVPVTSEAMIAAAPEVFLMMTDGLASIGGEAGLEKLPGVAQTPAGRNKRIVDMADSVLLSFGPNTGLVLKALADAVYSHR